jgi:hypothetical protein
MSKEEIRRKTGIGEYTQTKYLDHGPLGRYYARKEYNLAISEKQKEEELLAAQTANIFKRWSTERVVDQMYKDKRFQILMLMISEMRNYLKSLSPEQRLNSDFVRALNQHVGDLSVSQNLDFLEKSFKNR